MSQIGHSVFEKLLLKEILCILLFLPILIKFMSKFHWLYTHEYYSLLLLLLFLLLLLLLLLYYYFQYYIYEKIFILHLSYQILVWNFAIVTRNSNLHKCIIYLYTCRLQAVATYVVQKLCACSFLKLHAH